MRHTKYLIFEITTKCNLGKEHGKCPNLHPDRYKLVDTSHPLSDDKIVSLAKEAYVSMGFKGLIGFHYYNEPLMAKDRMLGLIKRIKNEIPQAKFILWSNGELISTDCSELVYFDKAVITDYHGKDFKKAQSVLLKKVNILKGSLDGRLNAKGYPSRAPCVRMFTEFIVDYFGNVHICCIDWRGEVKVGNVRQDSLSLLMDRWHILRKQISGIVMSQDAPEVCRKCNPSFRCPFFRFPDSYYVWRSRFRLLINNPFAFLGKCVRKIKGFGKNV